MLDHFDLLSRIYDRVMPAPDGRHLRTTLDLPAHGRLLDAGGGTGRVSAALLGSVDGIIVTDVSAGMLARVRDKRSLVAVRAHAERLPFPDASFARVLVVDALHHFCDQREALRDLLRVLEPSGRLAVQEPDLTRFPVKLVAVAERLALMRSRFLTPEAIRDILDTLGARASIVRDRGYSAWVIAARAERETP